MTGPILLSQIPSTHPAGVVHMENVFPRHPLFKSWDRVRRTRFGHGAAELFAEFLGVFMYTWGGVGPTAAFVIGNIAEKPLGSLLTVGFGYAFGILFAITICASTSGGHFNPCVTIARILFEGFPAHKGLAYMVAQIFGGYVACMLIYTQYRDLILATEAGVLAGATQAVLNATASAAGSSASNSTTSAAASAAIQAAAQAAADSITFSPLGTAGIFAFFLPPGVKIGSAVLNELVTDFVLALVIWGSLDPTNILVPPQLAGIVIPFAYAVAAWGYSVPGLGANTARDVGGRLAALTIYGMKASGGAYAAVSALGNIASTLLAVIVYEMFLRDTRRVIPSAQREFLEAHLAHDEQVRMHHSGYRQRDRVIDNVVSQRKNAGAAETEHSVEKGSIGHEEVV